MNCVFPGHDGNSFAMKRALLAFVSLLALGAQAAEVNVLVAPAARQAMTALVPSFERQSGYRLALDYREGDLAAIASKDERIDVVVTTVAQMGELTRAYRTMPDTRRTLGRTEPTAEAPQGIVLVIAALKGQHEEAGRAFTAYLTLPESIQALRRNGLASP